MRTFVDTNVLVYLYDQDDDTKRAKARQIMVDADRDLVLSAQVLGEFYVTVTRKIAIPLSETDARSAVDSLAELEVAPLTRNLVLDAVGVSEQHQLSYWDALIVETASRAGADQILTEDLSTGATLRGVEIVNPF